MLSIYVDEKDIENKDIIEYNDIQFNQDCLNNSFNSNLLKLGHILSNVEKGTLLNNKNVRTVRNDIVSIENISSGSKILYNIINNSNKIVNVVECGNNAMEYLFKNIQDGNIYMPYLPYIEGNYQINVQVYYKGDVTKFNNVQSLLEYLDGLIDN